MNQEIKQKLKQAAETAWEQDQKTNPSPVNPHAYVYGYKAGGQTILENPGEWGLASMVVVRQLEMETNIQHKEKTELQSQLTKYREALEAIATRWNKVAEHNEMRTALHLIQQDVFEALKQHDNE